MSSIATLSVICTRSSALQSTRLAAKSLTVEPLYGFKLRREIFTTSDVAESLTQILRSAYKSLRPLKMFFHVS